MHPLLRRLLSPTGFALVALCFLMPFATVSCGGGGETIEITYSGVDIATGSNPSIYENGVKREPGDPSDPTKKAEQDANTLGQVFAVLSLLPVLTGIAIAWLPMARLRALATIPAAALAALFLIAAETSTLSWIDAQLAEAGAVAVSNQSRFGFWLALLLLLVVLGFEIAMELQARGKLRFLQTLTSAPYPPGPPYAPPGQYPPQTGQFPAQPYPPQTGQFPAEQPPQAPPQQPYPPTQPF